MLFFCPLPSTNVTTFYTLTTQISSGSLLLLAASATPLKHLWHLWKLPSLRFSAFTVYCGQKRSHFAALLPGKTCHWKPPPIFEVTQMTSPTASRRNLFRGSILTKPSTKIQTCTLELHSPLHKCMSRSDSKQGTFLSGDKEVETVCSPVNGPCSKKKRNPEEILNSGAKVNIKQLLLSPLTNHTVQMNRKM